MIGVATCSSGVHGMCLFFYSFFGGKMKKKVFEHFLLIKSKKLGNFDKIRSFNKLKIYWLTINFISCSYTLRFWNRQLFNTIN